MINYYEELALDRSLELTDLNRALSKLESVWKARRTRNPEAATKKLALIVDARKVFASPLERARYDRELDESLNDTPGNEASGSEQSAGFIAWRDKAEAFHNQGQSDLALAALRKAMSALSGTEADVDFHLLAAEIYTSVGDTGPALEHVNEVILEEPTNYMAYFRKAMVYGEVGRQAHTSGQYEESCEAIVSQRACLSEAAVIARKLKDDQGYGMMLGAYAFSLFNYDPKNVTLAETWAKEAVQVGDTLGNAQSVLDDIAQERRWERQQRIEEELENRRILAKQRQVKAEHLRILYRRTARRIEDFDSMARQIVAFEEAMDQDRTYYRTHPQETDQYLMNLNKISYRDKLTPTAQWLRDKLDGTNDYW